jgi:hypothetical protein
MRCSKPWHNRSASETLSLPTHGLLLLALIVGRAMSEAPVRRSLALPWFTLLSWQRCPGVDFAALHGGRSGYAPFAGEKCAEGRHRPAEADTMGGLKQLDNLQFRSAEGLF